MKKRRPRKGLYWGLPLLSVLLIDFWHWDDPRLVLGIPIGLAYHISYCFLVAAAMEIIVRQAWPAEFDDSSEEEQP